MDDAALEGLLARLVTPGVIYFPIRHHSPACAWHLEQLIRECRPRAVLVEGPASFTSLIPLILHPKTRAPMAVYTSFVGESAPNLPPALANLGPPRAAAYYPFCDYSPELVALRTGAAVEATLRFIDLDYAEQVQAEREALEQSGVPRVESLLAERHFKRSRFLQALARRAGCRDHNDLWDHLFETRLGSSSNPLPDGPATESLIPKARLGFLRDVASWCYYARVDTLPAELEADGTLAREQRMAANIQAVLAEARPARTGPLVVVTGGFHTVALPDLVAGGPARPSASAASPAKAKSSGLTCLVRYSFEQLDALNGYAAGMPAPFYYDQLWQKRAEMAPDLSGGLPDPKRKRRPGPGGEAPGQPPREPFTPIAANVLVHLGQTTRRKKMAAALSPADEIAALEQARRLAAFRGHPGPTREDLLDGIRSCFVKGSMDAEGEVVLGLARHALAGTSIGEVPAEAGVPPLVQDFKNTAEKLRLKISDSVRRKTSLDLYRKTSHRQASRFLHSLCFLDVPFGTMMAGPDFVKGTGLERLFEHWDYQWTPQTESHLVEASVYGATLEEATVNRLVRATAELEKEGRNRNAAEAVGMLIQACRMGLHRHTERLRTLIAQQISEDPDFKSLAQSLNQLVLLWESREPLEAHQLEQIPALIHAAYERACFLLHDLANTPAEAAQETLQALIVVRDVLRTEAAGELLDSMLYFEPLLALVREPKAPALLAGGAAGLLRSADRMDENELLKILSGYLNSATAQAGDQIGFLIGLLRTCRELAWRQPALTEAIERLLAGWGEDEFIERLPHLRLAFADLTPRETDQVADVVAQLHGGQKLGTLTRPELSEGEMIAALRLNATVQRALEQDGLSDWLQPAADPSQVHAETNPTS